MKKTTLLLLIIISIIACSKEDDKPNILGIWDGKEIRTIYTSQVFTLEDSSSFEIDFKENGEGTSDRRFSTKKEIHWVVDELENKAFIIESYLIQNDEEVYSTTVYDIERNTASEQIWKRNFSYASPPNGDTVEQFITLTLLK